MATTNAVIARRPPPSQPQEQNTMNFLPLNRILTRQTVSLTLLFSLIITNAFAVRPISGNAKESMSTPTVLATYTTDLTQLGREGSLRESLSFDKETNSLVEVLGKGGSRQPVLVDETGECQSLIVEQLAIRIAKGNVPDSLKDKSVVKLLTNVLFSRTKSAEESAAIVNAVIDHAIASNGKTILFIDSLAQFVDAKASKLAAAISEGKVAIIGGSSKAFYADRIESSEALDQLFTQINVSATNVAAEIEKANRLTDETSEYKGDNLSPDLRDLMAQDPSGKKRVDVILQAKNADNPVLRSMLADGQARIIGRIGKDETLVVSLPLSALQSLSSSGLINYISPDRSTQTTGHVEDTTGAAQMRTQPASGSRGAYTLDGTGVGVAILDSGIYAAHNGFSNSGGVSRIVANVNFAGAQINQTSDAYGHGTHVAGLAIGSSTYNNAAYRGIAPNAKIISVKVLGDNGSGQTSWLLNGLNWVLQNKAAYNIRVVNLSLSTAAVDSYVNDPICLKVKELVNNGIVVVAAAGNNGKTSQGQKAYGTIGSPGNSPYVITVGAGNSYGTTTHADDSVTTYSSRGPTRSYYVKSDGTKVHDNLTKPDLVAPGNRLISYEAFNCSIAGSTPSLEINPYANKNDGMMYLGGTSTAAPVVSGAAALLMQVNPNLTPGMVKMLMEYSAQPIAGATTWDQGAGQLNIDGAVRLARTLRTDLDFQVAASNNSPIVPNG